MSKLFMKKNEIDLIKKTAGELLGKLEIESSVSVSENEEGVVNVDISGDDLGILIGYHGETLSALQLILNLMTYKKLERWQPLVVDVGGWRKKREEALERLAKRMAERVKFSEEEQELPPMSPFERRVIHLTLSEDPKVSTESIGEDSERRVVVMLKKK